MNFILITKLLICILTYIPFLIIIITFSENPIFALLSFNILILSFIICFHILKIKFLALILFLIYFGGILILFLFAILLLNLKNFKPYGAKYKLTACWASSILYAYLKLIGNPILNWSFTEYLFDIDLNNLILFKNYYKFSHKYYFLHLYENYDINFKN